MINVFITDKDLQSSPQQEQFPYPKHFTNYDTSWVNNKFLIIFDALKYNRILISFQGILIDSGADDVTGLNRQARRCFLLTPRASSQ